MEMGDRIRKLRLEAKLSQEELGAKLGLQKSAIAKYENGRVENMKRSIVEQMSQIFDVTPAYLMGWEESIPQSDPTQPAFPSALSRTSRGETTLLSHYRELNETGKLEANKRVAELTQIQQYKQLPDPIIVDHLTLRAAHERTDIEITPEMRQHDEDIMNDPNF